MHNAVNMTAIRDFFFKSFPRYYSLIALEKTPVGLKGGQKFFLNNMNSFFIFLRRFSWIFLFFPSRSCRGGVFLSSDISVRAIKRRTEGKNLFRKSFLTDSSQRVPLISPALKLSGGQTVYELNFECMCTSETSHQQQFAVCTK